MKIKCPNCKSSRINIIEVSDGFTETWHYPEYDEGIKKMGDYSHTNGECMKCGHFWKFRKRIDIDAITSTSQKASTEPTKTQAYLAKKKKELEDLNFKGF